MATTGKGIVLFLVLGFVVGLVAFYLLRLQAERTTVYVVVGVVVFVTVFVAQFRQNLKKANEEPPQTPR